MRSIVRWHAFPFSTDMRKYFFKGIRVLTIFSLVNIGLTQGSQQPKYAKGKYEAEADSIRKENLAPKRMDSVSKSQSDKMPVIQPDTTKNTPMPAMEPDKNQHMPVKELSDTTKKK
jgi:hypothetical protein